MTAAITYMGFLQTACADGRSHLGTTRSCVNSMAAGTLKTTCTTGLEQLGGALASPFDTANQGTAKAHLPPFPINRKYLKTEQ